MSEKSEKSNEKGILARTATYTSKKARRAQTKVNIKYNKLEFFTSYELL